MDSFAETIAAQTERYLALWSETPAAFPDSLRRFSSSARAEKEGEVEILLEKTIPRLDHYGDMDQGARERYLGRAHTALGRLMTGEGDPEVNRFFDCSCAGPGSTTRPSPTTTSTRHSGTSGYSTACNPPCLIP
jgi:hypothetical protein